MENKHEQKYSFEEFRMYYKTTEATSDRKMRNNELNLSLSIAILIAIAFSWSWALSNLEFSFIVFLFTSLLSLLAVLFCSLWIQQIKKATYLNYAKFEVLAEMASKIKFPDDQITSYQPFDKEWDKLRAMGVVSVTSFSNKKDGKKNGKGVTVFRSTELEEYIPAALRMIYCLSAFASIIAICLMWHSIYNLIAPLLAKVMI